MTTEPNNEFERPDTIEEQTIFLTARGISDFAERKRFIERCCGADSDLYNRIISLLRVDCEEPDFLKQPIARSDLSALCLRVGPERGDSVGAYVLIEPLGTGGMGIVWLAEQRVPILRRVAIKIMNTGFGTELDLQQFDSERQLLAMMDHPGIVKLLDAGNTVDGRPWFAMELVTGQKITDYCRQRQLSLRDRLELFLGVCESVEHAHKRGVVHRDLKPANILITEAQDRPTSRLIDFGVSFPMLSETEEGDVPQTRMAVVKGTLAYMSPEQAVFKTNDVDHRTDIYSLGALLYELIAGVPPHFSPAWEKATPVERLQIICETSPPPLSECLRGQRCKSNIVTNTKRDDVNVVGRILASLRDRAILRDLQFVSQTACERDASNRYQSVQQFREDVRWCLEHRPLGTRINAAPSSFKADSALKFALRNARKLSVSIGLVLCITAAGSFGAIFFPQPAKMNPESGLARNPDSTSGKRQTENEIRDSSPDTSLPATEDESKNYVDAVREAYFLSQQGQIDVLKSSLQLLREKAHRNQTENGDSLTFEERYLETLTISSAKSFQIHSGKVFDVRFTPDGSRVISCGGSETEYRTKVQDVQTGEVLTSFETGANMCFVRASDGVLLTAEDFGWVSAWDLSQPEPSELFRLDEFGFPVGKSGFHRMVNCCS